MFLVPFGVYAQSYSDITLAALPLEADQSSGLIQVDDRLITHNDGAGINTLYEISETGTLLSETTIQNADNVDWEDLCADTQFIYIADFGNNQGDRTDLSIYLVRITDFLANLGGVVAVEDTITYSYSDQVSFIPGSMHDFDAEAIIPLDDSLYVFTKNRTDDFTNIYSLSKTAGDYVAPRVDRIDSQGQITGGTYNTNSDEIMLAGYTSTEHFMLRISNFTGVEFSDGDVDRFLLTTPRTYQIEAIEAINDQDYHLTSETRTDVATLFRANFVAANAAPVITIDTPADGHTVLEGTDISFTATATDAEDDDATLTATINWNSSLDGDFGTGGSVNISTLTVGTHTITASVTDSDLESASDVISVTVDPLTIEFTTVSQTEGEDIGTLTATISLSQAPDVAMTVPFTVTGTAVVGAANDYTITASPLTINPGESTGDIVITVIDDSETEPAETVIITLETPSIGSLGADFVHTATITDNDPPVVNITSPLDGISEPMTTDITFTATAVDNEGDLSANLSWSSDLDGDIGTGGSFNFSDLTPGTHIVTASVTDSDGLTGEDAIIINITNTAPTVSITAPVDGTEITAGQDLIFSATATDAEEGDLSDGLTWIASLDGGIGNGSSVNTSSLSVGTQSITANSTDGGGLTGSDEVTVIVVAAMAAPTDISIDNASVAENQPTGTTVGTFSTTDPDVGDTHTYTLVSGTGDTDNASFSIVGDQLQTAAIFDFESASSLSIRVETQDALGDTYEESFTITVTDENESPTDISLDNATIAENQASGTAVGTFSTTDPDVGDTHTYTLVAGAGDTDNGSFSIVGSQLQTAAILDFESGSSLSIRVETQDATGATFEESFTITVTDENESPTDISLDNATIAENLSSGTAVGTFSTTDPDAGDSHTYTLVAGAGDTDNGSFSIVGSQLQTAAVLDFESGSSLSIRVETQDATGATFEESFTITVTDENESPTDISLDNATIAENQSSGTAVGTFSTTDPDAGDSHTYTLVAGAGDTDNGSFSIVGSQLQTAAVLDFESGSSLSIRVETQDATGATFEESFTITVTDENESPTDISLDNATIAENQPSGTAVGTFSTTDPDAGDSHTYTLVAGAGDTDNGSFSIVGSQLQTAAILDFESGGSLSIRVETQDATGATFEESFTITVTDENESPTDISLDNATVAEGQPSGTAVGTFSTTDPDAGDSHTYTLVAGTGDTDNGSFSIVGSQLQTAAVLNFESGSSLSIRVETQDATGATFEESFTITVTDENESPTDISLDNATVAEDQPTGTTVGTFSTTDPDAGDSHTYTLVAGAGDTDNASFSIAGNQLETAVILNFESGSSLSIRVQTQDAGGATFQESFTITVTDENEPPTDISLSNSIVAENQPSGTAVGTFSTTDPDAGDSHTYTLVAGAGDTDNASFSIAGNQLQTAAVLNFETGSSLSIRVQSQDTQGGTYQESFNITITDENDLPVAVDDIDNQTSGTSPINIDVAANDTDEDGSVVPSTVTLTSTPTNGTAVNNGDGTVTYTPNGVDGPDSFTYTIEDNTGATSLPGTVVITVGPNNPPVANDDLSNTTLEDVSLIINVIANDSDPDGSIDPTSINVSTNPDFGTAVANPDGTVTYTPNQDYNGSDDFSYTVEDNLGELSNAAIVVININPVNDPPVANDDNETTGEDTEVIVDVLANDNDLADAGNGGSIDPTTVALVATPANGAAAVNTDGTITYTPDPGYNGSDNFTYTVRDNQAELSNVATVTINITSVNDAPVANDDPTNPTVEETPVVINVIANDVDSDGTINASSVTLVDLPTDGVAVNNGDGTVTYTPNNEFNGDDTFTYTVEDDMGALSNTATVTIQVAETNDPPVAIDDLNNTINEDQSITINIAANDTDPEDALDLTSIAIVTPPTNGMVTINNNGSVLYTPNQDFNGSDSFGYTIADIGGIVSNEAQVTIIINDINDPPVATNDTGITDEDQAVNIDLIANDNDVDGTLVLSTLAIVSNTTNGLLVNNGDGSVTYTPNPDFNGSDSFSYTIEDDDLALSNTAVVNITINDINDAPIANDDATNTDEDTQAVIDLVANDTDVDGTVVPSSIMVVTAPANGTATANANGTITYDPDQNFNGLDTFTYTVEDDDGSVSNIATVTISVNDINDALVANDDDVITDEDQAVIIDILANDEDPDGTIVPSTVTIVTSPVNGTAVINTDGTVAFTPVPDYHGPDLFTYNVQNSEGQVSNIATVNITINDINDLPAAQNDLIKVIEDVAMTPLNIIENDSDIDGTIENAGVTVIAGPENGTLEITGGQVLYTPDMNFTGFDSFIYTVMDDDGGVSNEATATIEVQNANDPPEDLILSNTFVDEAEPIGFAIGSFTTVDVDPEETFTYSLVAGEGSDDNGAFSIFEDKLLLQVVLDQQRQEFYNVRIKTDDGESSLEKTFVITVFSINDPLFITPVDLPRLHDVRDANENYSIIVEEELEVERVLFRYRGITSPRQSWNIVPLTAGADRLYEGEILDSEFDELGVNYEFVVEDTDGGTINLAGFTYNEYVDEGINFEKMVFGESERDYNLFSIPLSLDNRTVTGVLEDELGSYDKTQWRLFGYQNDAYVEYTEGLNTLERGKGYWLIAKDQTTMDTGSGSTLLEDDLPFTFDLKRGWNLIGNPYNMNIAWLDILDFNGIVSQGNFDVFKTFENGYRQSGVLESFKGAFIFSDSSTTLFIPVEKNLVIQGRSQNHQPSKFQDEYNWEVDLNLSTQSLSNEIGGFGMRRDADNSKDPYDQVRLPQFIDYLDISFPKPEYFAKEFSKDVVPTTNQHIWEFTVETNSNDPTVRLDWPDLELAEFEEELWLYHRDLEIAVNMRDVGHYEFSNQKSHNFAVYFGDKDFINRALQPEIISLTTAYPNPFREELTVTFTLNDSQEAKSVSLSVYDLMGRKVNKIWEDKYQPGFYKVNWNGTANNGVRVPSGTYLLRLVVDGKKSVYKRVIKK